jgi:hypothetical protein
MAALYGLVEYVGSKNGQAHGKQYGIHSEFVFDNLFKESWHMIESAAK